MWIALATAEKELGLDISEEQIAVMRKEVDNIDWEFAAAKVLHTSYNFPDATRPKERGLRIRRKLSSATT